MKRTQLIAVIVLLVVAAGLVAGRVSSSSSSTSEPSQDTASEATSEAAGNATGTSAGGVEVTTTTTTPIAEPERLGQALQFTNLDGWLQTDATNLDDFDGQVRIVQFWTLGCHNCKATFPHLRDIYERWEPEGLEILAIHSPEFEYEKDPDTIAAAAVEHGLTWPIALDTNKTNFRSWQSGGRRFWPRVFVVDQTGEIRFDHIGEGAYEELESTVAFLLEHGP